MSGERENPNFSQKILLVIMGLFIPPLPVFLLTGPNYTILTKEFFVTVLLTFLGHIPGVLFAIYYVLVEYPKTLHDPSYTRIDEESRPRARVSPTPANGGYTDEPNNEIEVQAPAAGSSTSGPEVEAPPPDYEEIVDPKQREIDSKRVGDNKVQH